MCKIMINQAGKGVSTLVLGSMSVKRLGMLWVLIVFTKLTLQNQGMLVCI